jgi:hypothetical protein
VDHKSHPTDAPSRRSVSVVPVADARADGYVTSVALGVRVGWDGAAAADFSQAEYFRGFLFDEREEVAVELAASRRRLQGCVQGGQVVGFRAMSRARYEVRDLEVQHRELDRMIAALDT